jgi:hypothetical protein
MEQLDQDFAGKIREAGLESQRQLVQRVPGVQETSAAAIPTETGAEMTPFLRRSS